MLSTAPSKTLSPSVSQGHAAKDFGYVFGLDQHPWPSGTVQEHKAFAQTNEVMRAGILRSRSSLAEAYACRNIGSKDSPIVQYQDFLTWLDPVQLKPITNQGWQDQSFPGNGWIFNDLRLNPQIQNFVANLTAWAPKAVNEPELNPEGLKERALDILDDLSNAEIIKLRGLVIINPDSRNRHYHLMSDQEPRESFSYVVYNDHYANPVNATAFLVPTRIIKTAKSLAAFRELLAPEKLRKNPSIINLGSISVFGGGLTNGRAIQSKPYHNWEIDRGSHDRDLVGHVHKNSLPNLLEARLGFQYDQSQIYHAANRFGLMLYQLDLLEALHIQGYTNDITTSNEGSSAIDSNSAELYGDLKYALDLFSHWRDYYSRQPEPRTGFESVLVDADIFDKASKPDSWTVKLDPSTNKVYWQDANQQIRVEDIPRATEDLEVRMLQLLNNDFRTLRFVPNYLTTKERTS